MATDDFAITINKILIPPANVLRTESKEVHRRLTMKVVVGIAAPSVLLMLLVAIGVPSHIALSVALVTSFPLIAAVGSHEVSRQHREIVLSLRRYWCLTLKQQNLPALALRLNSINDEFAAIKFLELWVTPGMPVLIGIIAWVSHRTGNQLSLLELFTHFIVCLGMCSWIRLRVLHRLTQALPGKS